MNNDSPIIEQVLDKLKIKIGQLHNLVAVIGLSYYFAMLSSCRNRNSYLEYLGRLHFRTQKELSQIENIYGVTAWLTRLGV